jgi:hypothetical protein
MTDNIPSSDPNKDEGDASGSAATAAPPSSNGSRNPLGPVFYILMAIVGAIIVAVFLGLWMSKLPVIDQLRNPDYARGLITFLVSVGAVTFGLILLITALFASDPKMEDQKFRRAREIFTVFTGILGTIVGFYFGSAEKGVSKFDLAVTQESAGDHVRLTAHANGGTPPYRYVVRPLHPEPAVSEDGWFTLLIPLTAENKGQELSIEVSDGKDQQVVKKLKLLEPRGQGPKAQAPELPAGSGQPPPERGSK